MESSFKADIITNFSSQSVGLILGFISSILIARIIGASGRGEIYLISTISSVGLLIGNLGIPASNIFLIAKKRYSAKQIFGNSVLITLTSGSVLLITGLVYLHVTGKISKEIDNSLVIIGILITPLLIAFSNISSILQGMGKTLLYNQFNIITQAIGSFFLIAIIIFTKSSFWYVFATCMIAIFNLIALFSLSHKFDIICFSFNRDIFKNQIAYSLQSYISHILTQMVLRADVFLVTYYLGIEKLGYYAVAAALCEAMLILPYAMSGMLFPRASSVTVPEMTELVTSTFKHTLLLVFAAAIFLMTTAGIFIPLIYGEAFRPAILPTILLSPAMIALGITSVVLNGIASLGTNKILIVAPLTALAVNIALNLVLLPKIGIIGASLASTIAYWIEAIISFFVLYRLLGIKLADYFAFGKKDINAYLQLVKWK